MKFQLKIKFIFLFVLVSGSIAAQQVSPLLIEVRQKMPKAFESEDECKALYKKLSPVKDPDPLLKGYIGGVNIAMSKHVPIIDKPGYFRRGTALLEEAIKEKPNTLELIFLRLTIQIHLPSFLGYDDNLDEDKKFVLEHCNSAPPDLRERIAGFIQKSDYFTVEEKSRVNATE